MQLRIAKSAGFCFGVKNAVDLAMNSSGDNIYTLGELIHNETVINKLKAKGIKSAESIDDIPDVSTVIIRSHGEGEAAYQQLNDKHCHIIDATCPYVEKIHQIVKEHYNNGYRIIIIGSINHPEVIGINGWCRNSAIIIDDTLNFPKFSEGKYCVVVQTTFDFSTYEQIVDLIKKHIKTVALYETICYTTKVRQNEAYELASDCNLMLVIGSNKSANTKKLYDISKSVCDRTYMISDISDLKSVIIIKNDIVGVTAGASTPKELMMEVINTMVNHQDGVTEINGIVDNEKKSETATVNQTTELADANVAGEKKTNQSPKETELTMDDVMNKTKFVKIREGKRVKGTVISSNELGVYVNIGMGKDGFIDKDEVSLEGYEVKNYTSGTEVEAIVILGTSKDYITLSKKRLDQTKLEDMETEKVLKGNEFTLACNEVVKGGLVGKMGSYTVFVPASELRIGYVADLEQYKGKPLRLRAIPEKEKVNPNPDANAEVKKHKSNLKRIVASQRVILSEEKEAKEEHFWAEMIPGNIVEGKVKRYAPFGVFVQVMGFDCLVHISDVSWTKIDDASKVLKANETYEFEILRADREKGRVSLSYKSLQKTPYELAAIKYPVGAVVKGTVDRIATFGAFIKLEDGVDGLVHVSQISHDWIKDAAQALKIGQEVEAKVIKFEDNKITLSIKELLPEPIQIEVEEKKEQVAENTTTENKPKRGFKKSRDNDYQKKTANTEEYREWVGQDNGVTIGDLFAGLKDIVPGDEEKE